MLHTNNYQLNGIIPPLVTPLQGDGTLDIEMLHRLINHVVEGGVNGLFILGTTGEAPSLSESLKREMIAETCRYIDHQVPVLVGITDTSWTDSIALAKIAATHQATGLVTSTPFYFPLSQNDLFEYIKKLTDEVSLPLYLYNMPSCTKTVFEIETLKKLSDIPNIAGIKDSSGDMIYLKKLLQLKKIRRDWSILVGPEELLAEAILNGADGGVTGGANLYPELYVSLYQAAVNHDSTIILAIQEQIMQICDCFYKPDYLQGLKYALSCKKLCKNILATPLQSASPEQQNRIQNYMTQHPVVSATASMKKRILSLKDATASLSLSRKESC